jgi:hypothetical protein
MKVAGSIFILIAVCFAGNVSAFEPLFEDRIEYYIGDSTSCIASGDINNDGIVDLVASLYRTDSISILLGNGDGTFQNAYRIRGFSTPQLGYNKYIVLDRFDADSSLDIAVIGASRLSVLFNNGSGVFGAPQQYNQHTNGNFLMAADLDSDGDKDLVALYSTNDTIGVLKNNGQGVFQSDSLYHITDYPRFACATDLDGDGDLDMATVNIDSDNLSILLNRGNGRFSFARNLTVGTQPWSVDSGDLDGDGDQDLVVANAASADISVLKNNGNATFLSAINYDVGRNLRIVRVLDLDGDNIKEVAVVGKYDNRVFYYQNNGTGVLSFWKEFNIGDGPRNIEFSDFNSDGLTDCAVGLYDIGFISVLTSDSNRDLEDGWRLMQSTYPTAIYSASFNQDNRTDLLALEATSPDSVAVISSVADSDYSISFGAMVFGNASSAAIGDFTGDGNTDFAVASWYTPNDTIIFWAGNGNGGFLRVAALRVPSNVSYIATADFNLDSRPDLAVMSSNNWKLTLLSNEGNFNFDTLCQITAPAFPSMETADIDVDGYPDVIIADSAQSRILIAWNPGDSLQWVLTPYQVSLYPNFTYSTDIDGDGDRDIVVVHNYYGTGQQKGVFLLRNLGNRNFEQVELPYPTIRVIAALVADFDGDELADIVALNYSGNIGFMKNNGGGTFQSPIFYGVGWGPRSLSIGDFDGDNHPDLAVANTNGCDIAILRNRLYASGIEDNDSPRIPKQKSLLSAYPNPFNSSTTISLLGIMDAQITIFDITGRQITAFNTVGSKVVWNASGFPSGLYFARAQTEKKSEIIKMLLLK